MNSGIFTFLGLEGTRGAKMEICGVGEALARSVGAELGPAPKFPGLRALPRSSQREGKEHPAQHVT